MSLFGPVYPRAQDFRPDGITPTFTQVGADPSVAGFDLPIGSIVRHSTDYFYRWGPAVTDWATIPNLTKHTTLETKTVSAPSTTQTFSGLDGNTSGQFLGSGRLVNASAGTSDYDLLFNGSAVGVTYQRIYGAGAAVFADTFANNCQTGGSLTFYLYLDATTGIRRHGFFHAVSQLGSGAMAYATLTAVQWSDTAANLTSLAVRASLANGIGPGSMLSLEEWKR